MNLDAGTLQVRRAIQRFGGDAAARRPLLAQRKRLRAMLKALDDSESVETRTKLVAELQVVRDALKKVKTSVQFTELKSARSRRTIALPAVAVARPGAHRDASTRGSARRRGRWQDRGWYSPARSERPSSRGT